MAHSLISLLLSFPSAVLGKVSVSMTGPRSFLQSKHHALGHTRMGLKNIVQLSRADVVVHVLHETLHPVNKEQVGFLVKVSDITCPQETVRIKQRAVLVISIEVTKRHCLVLATYLSMVLRSAKFSSLRVHYL